MKTGTSNGSEPGSAQSKSETSDSKRGAVEDSPAVPSLTVTIVNHEARDALRSCLQSLEWYPCESESLEIIVLDNASRDGSIEMLSDEFPLVTLLTQETRRGFGANQNRAVAAGRGELVFMLNPDALVGPGTIDALAEAVRSEERVVAAGCRMLNADGTARQERPLRFPTPLNISFHAFGLGRVLRDRRSRRDATADYWLSGGAMMIDRQAFLDVGGFDESYFMYSEDVDLCKRLRMSGLAFAWVSHVVAVHPLPEEAKAISRRRQREMIKSELLYMRKYYGRIGQFVYRLRAAAGSVIRFIGLGLPWASRVINTHGRSSSDVRLLYAARVRELLSPPNGDDFEDLAAAWNSRRRSSS